MPSSTPGGSCTTLADVLQLLDWTDVAVVEVWLDGGWGVDALLGRQTRPHADVDVVIRAGQLEAFIEALAGHGFRPLGGPGATAWNFLLGRPDAVVVDVHAVVFDADGAAVLEPADAGNVYPPGSLTGRGGLGHRTLGCVPPTGPSPSTTPTQVTVTTEPTYTPCANGSG